MKHPAFELDWNLIRTFVAVARAGSLAQGARSLGITHPTAARHVQLLEESIGLALFTRTGKGLVLNEAGEQLHASASLMHDSAMAFQAVSEGVRDTPVGRVRVSVSELLAELVPLVIQKPNSACGAFAVDMLVTSDIVNLLQREADIAIRHVRPSQQELVCRRLGSVQMGVFAHHDYVSERGEISEGALEGHTFIDGLSQDNLVRGAAKSGWVVAPEQVVFRSDCISSRRRAVSAGWGIGAFPVWTALEETQWRSVMPKDAVIDMEVWLVGRPEVRDSAHFQALFTELGDDLTRKIDALQAEGDLAA